MKTPTLVTGGTGCVGANIIKHLNDRGIKPRVLLRETSKTTAIDDLEWEPVYGDVTDPQSLEKAVEGCEWVFHSAAIVSFWHRRWDEIMRVNVEGSRNLLEASQRAGVKKFVFTSSMAAVGFSPDPESEVDENSPWNYEPYRMVYQTSKRKAEELVLKSSNDDFHTFAINPGMVFGERDVNLNAARYFKYLKNYYIPFISKGGVMISDADDVAEGHILAAEKGRPGERYIIANEYLSHLDLNRMVAKIVGGRPPRWTLPGWLVIAAGHLGDFMGYITGKEPSLNYDMAVVGNAYEHATSAKAQSELGLKLTPEENGNGVRSGKWKKH